MTESRNQLKTQQSQTEWDIYNEWTDYENSPELKLDGIIHLRADPTMKRRRLDKPGVTLDYLKGTGFIYWPDQSDFSL